MFQPGTLKIRPFMKLHVQWQFLTGLLVRFSGLKLPTFSAISFLDAAADNYRGKR